MIRRFLRADGMSHARALAYETAFVAMSGFIGLVGLAGLLNVGQLRGVVQELARSISPAPAGRLLAEAARSGSSGGGVAAGFGLAAALLAGTLAMAQLERSGNRLAGLGEDRSPVRRYATAFLLAATVGVLLTGAALVVGAGHSVAAGFGLRDEAETVWSIVRWPVGLAGAFVAVAVLFRLAPRRRLGGRAVLAGAAVAVALWAVVTGLLSLYFSIRGSSPYGPLIVVVALLLWSMLTSVALHLGLATSAELSGAGGPERSDPGAGIRRARSAASTT
jgi:YihY family inner membrane protein